MEKKRQELILKMQEPGFWDRPDTARTVTQEEKTMQDQILEFRSMEKRIRDSQEMMELAEQDEELAKELFQEVKELKRTFDEMKVKVMLSGEYDGNEAILSLKSGAGGTDAMDWTEMLLRMYIRWGEKRGYTVEVLSVTEGDEAGIREASLRITGPYAYGYLKAEKGIHRLVRISPFNSSGKRQTSFASVEVMPVLKPDQDIEIKDDELRIDTYRSGGAGGQHVNTTDSAVRITHLPTGIVVACQNERSQFQNKDTAMNMLKAKLVELKDRLEKEKIEDIAGELKDVGWGSQIRSYVFNPYNLVKDHRTSAENANVDAVMDGNIDLFISEYLKQSNNGKLKL